MASAASSLRKLGIKDHEKVLRRQVDTDLALDGSLASGDPLEAVNGDKVGAKKAELIPKVAREVDVGKANRNHGDIFSFQNGRNSERLGRVRGWGETFSPMPSIQFPLIVMVKGE